jgi:hypothetical protein
MLPQQSPEFLVDIFRTNPSSSQKADFRKTIARAALHEAWPLGEAITPLVAANIAPASPKRQLDSAAGLNICSQHPKARAFLVKRDFGGKSWHVHFILPIEV